MLIHLSPRLYVTEMHTDACALIDVRIDDFGLLLRSGNEVVARRPYPNKRYLVACRRVGRKAVSGILIDAPVGIREFTAVTRWAIDSERVITHTVKYVILDDEFDAITETMMLWRGTGIGSRWGFWSSRWPVEIKGSPATSQPRMEVVPIRGEGARVGDVHDILSPNGWITERRETFRLPSVERDRIVGERAFVDRLPSMSSAFQVR